MLANLFGTVKWEIMIRLFTGIALPPFLYPELAPLRQQAPHVAWQPAQKLHITLRFIGEIEDHKTETMGEKLASVKIPAFRLSLQSVASFFRRRAPSILWLGVEPKEDLVALKAAINAALAELDLPPDSHAAFRPHVTIGKIKPPVKKELADFLETHKNFCTNSFAVKEFSLFESRNGEYMQLCSYPLLAGGL